MRKLSLENPEIIDILNHQVIHMDQGITYTPEYLATRKMSNYPSRTAQIIRSVYLGELDASEYGAEMVFSPILSGQGERWQNFGEKPEGYLLSVMLGRELFYNKGQKKEELDALKAQIDKNNGYLEKSATDIEAWKEALPINADSKTGLLLDEATFTYAKRSREKIGEFLQAKGITVSEFGPYFTGFDLLVSGFIKEGIETVKALITMWEEKGIRKIITLCGQSHYLFTGLLKYLDLDTEIEFISILDLAEGMNIEKAYIYGGSYFTRYAQKATVLNNLLVNTEETPLSSHPEFLPEVEGDKKKNIVSIWTPPLCAEYHTAGTSEMLKETIYTQSLATIEETSFKKLVVCDPFAWKALRAHNYPEEKMVYFADILY